MASAPMSEEVKRQRQEEQERREEQQRRAQAMLDLVYPPAPTDQQLLDWYGP